MPMEKPNTENEFSPEFMDAWFKEYKKQVNKEKLVRLLLPPEPDKLSKAEVMEMEKLKLQVEIEKMKFATVQDLKVVKAAPQFTYTGSSTAPMSKAECEALSGQAPASP
jgi:hypothetical protein